MTAPIVPNNYHFLSGGGEMGQLMRDHDWSKSPIGDPSTWPQPLRTTLALILNSRFPMFIFWGPQEICFYNDAYRPSLGNDGKHPGILGMPGKEAWQEIWHIIKPLMINVIATGEATWAEDQLIPIYRNRKIEDVYWTFSYSPIKDEDGSISGILVTCTETTSKILTLKKLEEAESRFRNTLVQAPVGIVVLRGDDHIVELANQPYLQLVDREEATFINRPLFDSLPEVKDTVGKLLDGVLKTGLPYYGNDLEIPIKRHGKIESAWFNFVYQPLKEVDDSISGIMVVVTEVTAQIKAKHLLSESEKQFRNMVMQSPIPMTIFSGPDLIIDMANTQMFKNIWRKEEADVLGKKLLDVFPELNDQKYPALLKKVMETKEAYRENESLAYVQGDDGLKKFYLDLEYSPIMNPDASVYGVMVTISDVTEKVEARKKIEESQNRLSMAVQATKLGTWEYSPLTENLTWSQECKDIYALPDDVPVNYELFSRLIHPSDEKVVQDTIAKAMDPNGDGHYKIDYRILRYTDKRVRWIRSQGSVLFTDDNKVDRFIGTVIDITESKTAEEEGARMAAIVQSSEDAIVSKTLQGIVTAWNDSAERIFGYTAAEMIGESIIKLLPADRFDEETDIISRISKGERVEHFETIRKHKSGSVINVSVSISPIKDSNGKILGASKIARDITDKKRADKILEDSEVRLRLATEGTKLATWDLDLTNGEIIYSPRLAEIFGHDKDASISWTQMREQIEQHDRKHIVEKAFEEAKQTGTYFYEARVIKPNKKQAWIRTQGKVIFDEMQKPVRMIGTLIDITEEKNAALALEDSRMRMNIAIDAAELGTWELDVISKNVIYSKRYLEILGFAEDDEPDYEELLKRIHPDDIEKRSEAIRQAFKTGTLDSEIRLIIGKTGSIRWVKTKGKVFYDADHKPIKLMGTIADVTEQKLYVKVMQESEEKFRLLADSMPQHIWTSDALGNLNYFNRSVYDFSGLTKEEIAKEGWLQIVHPDDREENVAKWMEAIATGEDFLYEHRFRKYDGEYRWQLSRAIPQKDSKGKIQMWVGTSTDIDEIKKHEQQKDDFIKTASHELKTPITTAKGYVQLLLKTHGAGNDVFLSESLMTIDKQILKLTKLITDLLDVTKIETGSLQLNKEVFPIAEVIEETAKDTNAASNSHKVVITHHANPLVYADKDRISQAVSNLFTNAIKYSPKADEIWVDISQEGDNVVIAVKDKGIGIAAEDHKKIFDRFFRATGKDEKTFPGFGIGLFIVNEILTLHKGKVWVKSEKDEGATFYFSLAVHH